MSRTRIQLHDINNVQADTPLSGEVLTYNGTNWVNAPTAESNRIFQRDSELAIHDVDGTPSNLTLKFDNTQIIVADNQQAIFNSNNNIWISYAF